MCVPVPHAPLTGLGHDCHQAQLGHSTDQQGQVTKHSVAQGPEVAGRRTGPTVAGRDSSESGRRTPYRSADELRHLQDGVCSNEAVSCAARVYMRSMRTICCSVVCHLRDGFGHVRAGAGCVAYEQCGGVGVECSGMGARGGTGAGLLLLRWCRTRFRGGNNYGNIQRQD